MGWSNCNTNTDCSGYSIVVVFSYITIGRSDFSNFNTNTDCSGYYSNVNGVLFICIECQLNLVSSIILQQRGMGSLGTPSPCCSNLTNFRMFYY